MNKCLLCGLKTNRPKYCSAKCVKHSWYLRKYPHKASFGKKEFWATATGIGFTWEKWVAEKIGATHLPFNNGCDLNWKGKLIDVKAANLYKRKNKRGKPVLGEQKGVWVFNRNKKKPCDFFICVCLVDNKPRKILMIPAKNFPKKGCVIGNNSKYDRFIYVYMRSKIPLLRARLCLNRRSF